MRIPSTVLEKVGINQAIAIPEAKAWNQPYSDPQICGRKNELR
jgi:hypothetical protein